MINENDVEINLIPQKVTFLDNHGDWVRGLKKIAYFTRIAYRSENIGKTKEEKFHRDNALIERLLIKKDGDTSPRHTSTTEHVNFGVTLITSRGIANELVRHRHTAFTQESTRYVNFGKKSASFIIPSYLEDEQKNILEASYKKSFAKYLNLLESGVIPQDARDVLPLGLATVLGMSTNFAEWRSIFNLRCDKGAHPMVRSLAFTILEHFAKEAPCAFGDLYDKYKCDNIPCCESNFAIYDY